MPDPPALQCENDYPGPAGSWEGFSLFPTSPHGNIAISIVTLLSGIGQPK
jgi:hypothetical protein